MTGQAFCNLRKPEEETAGQDTGKWYVRAELQDWPAGGCLMNDGSHQIGSIKWTEEENEIFYFDTELAAYNAIEDYYHCHGVKFPYSNERLLAEFSEAVHLDVSELIVEQEVMEFE